MAGGLLAERAGRGAERQVSSKSTPTDLVSEADLAAERAIRELLAARRPDDGFVGEEEGGARRASAACAGWSTRSTGRSTSCSASRSGRSASPSATSGARSPVPSTTRTGDELFTATRDGPALLEGPAGTAPLSGRSGRPARWGRRAGKRPGDGDGRDRARLRRRACAAAQAQVLARLAATGARHPSLRQRRARPRLDGVRVATTPTTSGASRPWDIAAGALICERAGLRRAGAGRGARTCPGGSSRPDRRSPSRCWSWSTPAERAAPRDRCGGWESNPHALSDRAF